MPPVLRPLFVYGTLRHPVLLAAVLGHELAPRTMRQAVAPGYRAAIYPGRTYPAIAAAPGREAAGLLLTGLSSFDRDALDAFEGDEYRRGEIEVRAGSDIVAAEVYRPVVAISDAVPDWSYASWEAEHAAAMIAEIDSMNMN